ncbi:MAG: hypothetical protein FJ271_26565 [Planctomycetes bacterium]|nr:hypothetical protein [Planctomycetota bacterium]
MACPIASEREYPDHVESLRTNIPEIAAEIAGFRGMGEVLDWLKERGLIPGAVDIVAQDEFESDFLVQLEPGGRWLVFGIT